MKICDNTFDELFQRYCRVESWQFMKAISWVESNYVAHAVSRTGAIGLMQIMPATGAFYGYDDESELYDPLTNIMIGCRHFESMYWRYDGDVEKAVAAYNCGGGLLSNIIAQYGSRWKHHLPAETKAYVPKVMSAFRQVKACPI